MASQSKSEKERADFQSSQQQQQQQGGSSPATRLRGGQGGVAVPGECSSLTSADLQLLCEEIAPPSKDGDPISRANESGVLLERFGSLQMDEALKHLLQWDSGGSGGSGGRLDPSFWDSSGGKTAPQLEPHPPAEQVAGYNQPMGKDLGGQDGGQQKRMSPAGWGASEVPALKFRKAGIGGDMNGGPRDASSTQQQPVGNGGAATVRPLSTPVIVHPFFNKSLSFHAGASTSEANGNRTDVWNGLQLAPRIKLEPRMLTKAASFSGPASDGGRGPAEVSQQQHKAGSSSSDERAPPKKERGGARVRFSNYQQEQLRALAEAVQWNTAAVDQTEASEEVCRQVGIDRKQLKKWIGNHRPKELRATNSGGGCNPALSRTALAMRKWQTPPLSIPPETPPYSAPLFGPSTPSSLSPTSPHMVTHAGDLLYGPRYPLTPPSLYPVTQPLQNPLGGPSLRSFAEGGSHAVPWQGVHQGYASVRDPLLGAQRRATGDWAGLHESAGEDVTPKDWGAGGKLKLRGDPGHVKELVQVWMAARLKTLTERHNGEGDGKEGGSLDATTPGGSSLESSRAGSPVPAAAIDAVFREALEVVGGDGSVLAPARAVQVAAQGGLKDVLGVLSQQDKGTSQPGGAVLAPPGSTQPRQVAGLQAGVIVAPPQEVKGTARGLGFLGKGAKTAVQAVLFEKVLTKADVTHRGQIVLPKEGAEQHLPVVAEDEGMHVTVEDRSGGRWRLRYRYWPHSSGRIYGLEHTYDFVKELGLEQGDTLVFCRSAAGHLIIQERKRRSSSDLSSLTSADEVRRAPTTIKLTSQQQAMKGAGGDGLAVPKKEGDIGQQSAVGQKAPAPLARLPSDFDTMTGLDVCLPDFGSDGFQMLTDDGALQHLARNGSLNGKEWKNMLGGDSGTESDSFDIFRSWPERSDGDLSAVYLNRTPSGAELEAGRPGTPGLRSRLSGGSRDLGELVDEVMKG